MVVSLMCGWHSESHPDHEQESECAAQGENQATLVGHALCPTQIPLAVPLTLASAALSPFLPT